MSASTTSKVHVIARSKSAEWQSDAGATGLKSRLFHISEITSKRVLVCSREGQRHGSSRRISTLIFVAVVANWIHSSAFFLPNFAIRGV